MEVDPTTAAGKHEHRGTTYYFCSEWCLKSFRGDPDRYLATSPAPRSTTPASSSPPAADLPYTCPMHPEVRQAGPGFCPFCGMALEPVAAGPEEENPELRTMVRRLRVSLAVTLPLFLMGMSEMLPGRPLAGLLASRGRNWIQLLLATPVVLWGGFPFFQRGWTSLVNRSLNMFTLIALGTGTAYAASVALLLGMFLFMALALADMVNRRS